MIVVKDIVHFKRAVKEVFRFQSLCKKKDYTKCLT